MSPMMRRITFLLFLLFLGAMTIYGQADQASPYNVNGPVDKVPVAWYETPILWIGLLVFALVGVLWYLRKGKTATNKPLHKY